MKRGVLFLAWLIALFTVSEYAYADERTAQLKPYKPSINKPKNTIKPLEPGGRERCKNRIAECHKEYEELPEGNRAIYEKQRLQSVTGRLNARQSRRCDNQYGAGEGEQQVQTKIAGRQNHQRKQLLPGRYTKGRHRDQNVPCQRRRLKSGLLPGSITVHSGNYLFLEGGAYIIIQTEVV